MVSANLKAKAPYRQNVADLLSLLRYGLLKKAIGDMLVYERIVERFKVKVKGIL